MADIKENTPETTVAPVQTAAAQPQAAAPQRAGRGPGRGGYGRQQRGPARYSDEPKEFDERVIFVNRVARVVKGGRRFRFQALVVVGDHKGRVGIGVSKGADVSIAVTKATESAKKHLVKLHLYKATIPHEAEAKVGGAQILVMPAAPGTGLIAGGVVRSVLEVSGIENALSKSHGSSNKINIAYATLAALQSVVAANKWVTYKPKAEVKK